MYIKWLIFIVNIRSFVIFEFKKKQLSESKHCCNILIYVKLLICGGIITHPIIFIIKI